MKALQEQKYRRRQRILPVTMTQKNNKLSEEELQDQYGCTSPTLALYHQAQRSEENEQGEEEDDVIKSIDGGRKQQQVVQKKKVKKGKINPLATKQSQYIQAKVQDIILAQDYRHAKVVTTGGGGGGGGGNRGGSHGGGPAGFRQLRLPIQPELPERPECVEGVKWGELASEPMTFWGIWFVVLAATRFKNPLRRQKRLLKQASEEQHVAKLAAQKAITVQKLSFDKDLKNVARSYLRDLVKQSNITLHQERSAFVRLGKDRVRTDSPTFADGPTPLALPSSETTPRTKPEEGATKMLLPVPPPNSTKIQQEVRKAPHSARALRPREYLLNDRNHPLPGALQTARNIHSGKVKFASSLAKCVASQVRVNVRPMRPLIFDAAASDDGKEDKGEERVDEEKQYTTQKEKEEAEFATTLKAPLQGVTSGNASSTLTNIRYTTEVRPTVQQLAHYLQLGTTTTLPASASITTAYHPCVVNNMAQNRPTTTGSQSQRHSSVMKSSTGKRTSSISTKEERRKSEKDNAEIQENEREEGESDEEDPFARKEPRQKSLTFGGFKNNGKEEDDEEDDTNNPFSAPAGSFDVPSATNKKNVFGDPVLSSSISMAFFPPSAEVIGRRRRGIRPRVETHAVTEDLEIPPVPEQHNHPISLYPSFTGSILFGTHHAVTAVGGGFHPNGTTTSTVMTSSTSAPLKHRSHRVSFKNFEEFQWKTRIEKTKFHEEECSRLKLAEQRRQAMMERKRQFMLEKLDSQEIETLTLNGLLDQVGTFVENQRIVEAYQAELNNRWEWYCNFFQRMTDVRPTDIAARVLDLAAPFFSDYHKDHLTENNFKFLVDHTSDADLMTEEVQFVLKHIAPAFKSTFIDFRELLEMRHVPYILR